MKVKISFFEFHAKTSVPERKHDVIDFKAFFLYSGHMAQWNLIELAMLKFLAPSQHNALHIYW